MCPPGTDLKCGARHLTPDTEYVFVVTALTNEGKFESKVTKKKTAKDECKCPLSLLDCLIDVYVSLFVRLSC